MCNSAAHNTRPNRESLSKRLGKVARQIKARDGYRCAYCQATERASGAAMQLDHLTPRALGGTDEPTNLITACRSCNSRRQSRTLSAWAAMCGGMFTARQIRGQARRSLPEAA